MPARSRGRDHAAARQLAAFVAVVALILLVFNVAAYGFDNLREGIRVLLLAATVVLAVWWQQTRARTGWVGTVLGVLAGVLLVFNLVSFGLHGFIGFLTFILLVFVCVASANYSFGKRATAGNEEAR